MHFDLLFRSPGPGIALDLAERSLEERILVHGEEPGIDMDGLVVLLLS